MWRRWGGGFVFVIALGWGGAFGIYSHMAFISNQCRKIGDTILATEGLLTLKFLT